MRLASITNVTKTLQTLDWRVCSSGHPGKEDQGNRVCTQANLQILVVDSEMIRPGPGSEWKMPRCTQLVSGQCTVVG